MVEKWLFFLWFLFCLSARHTEVVTELIVVKFRLKNHEDSTFLFPDILK